jgi:hypothetical protein
MAGSSSFLSLSQKQRKPENCISVLNLTKKKSKHVMSLSFSGVTLGTSTPSFRCSSGRKNMETREKEISLRTGK